MDGWLTLLVGQKVPTARKFAPTTAESELWTKLRAHIRSRGQQAFSVPEALAAVRSPRWKWNREFFLRG
jgi:tryptophan halogenase